MTGSQVATSGVRRWLAGAAIGVVLLAGVTAAVLALTHDGSAPSSGNADGDTIPPADSRPLPALIGDRADTAAYLAGPGKDLVTFWRTSAQLAELPAIPVVGAVACLKVGDDLMAAFPDIEGLELVEAAAGVPDTGLGEILLDDYTAKLDLLRSCGDVYSGEDPDGIYAEQDYKAGRAEVADSHLFTSRALERYGVR